MSSTDSVRRLHQFFFLSSRRRHTRFDCDWSSDVCSSDLSFKFSGKCFTYKCLSTPLKTYKDNIHVNYKNYHGFITDKHGQDKSFYYFIVSLCLSVSICGYIRFLFYKQKKQGGFPASLE